jgi:hypothetical protein
VSTPLPLESTDETVAVAWIATVPGLSAAMVDMVLPPDVDAQGNPTWAPTGFVTVAVVGGGPDPLLPVNRSVIQVDCWAVKPGSGKPPWMMARAIAAAIQRATWSRTNIPRPLTPVVNGVEYPEAIVQSATIVTSFRRMYSDAADYANYSADLQLSWLMAHDRLD